MPPGNEQVKRETSLAKVRKGRLKATQPPGVAATGRYGCSASLYPLRRRVAKRSTHSRHRRLIACLCQFQHGGHGSSPA